MSGEGWSRARNHLGMAVGLRAESIGPPGQRRFRLLVEGSTASAILWLEKGELSHLGVSIKRLLALTEEKVPESQAPSAEPRATGTYDFEVGSISLGQDDESGLFLFMVQELESERDTATLAWWANRGQIDHLADEALQVVAAGRPRCILCGGPLDPEPHVCPRHNGHLIL